MNAQMNTNADINIKGLFTMLEGWDEAISNLVIGKLLTNVEAYWPDITNNMQFLIDAPSTISENLKSSINFLISKCYYHMHDYYNSLNYALQSGSLFNLDEDSFYVKAMINTCIDQYKESRKANIEDEDIPSGIREIVDFIFSQSLSNHNISHLLGISIECNRLDLLEKALRSDVNLHSTLYSILNIIREFNYPQDVKTKVFHLLQTLFVEQGDRFGVFLCLLTSHNRHDLSALLIQCSREDVEIAYQMAFYLFELKNIKLCQFLIQSFPAEELQNPESPLAVIKTILTGKVSNDLYNAFIQRRTHHDNLLLEEYMKQISWEDTSVQEAMLVTNAITSMGGSNEFLMNHGSWIKKAENWTKYGIVASFALSQMFAPEKTMEALQNYLASENEEERGGGLYGYCICHMGEGDQIDETVLAQMRRIIRENGSKEMLVHAAAMGMGLIFYGSMDQGLAEELFTLINERPFVGFAAGIALGLVYCGEGDSLIQVEEAITEYYLPVIRETQHDRIAAGLAIGVSLMFYGTGATGLPLLQSMIEDSCEYIRMAGVLGLGLAFVGQHHNHTIISKLLKIIAADVSDNVRRNGVMALGFVFINKPEEFIPTAVLLLQSYNPHIRYATAVIAGLINAGSANKQLVSGMMPLMEEKEDFVVQGAAMGLGALFMECNEKVAPEAKQYREKLKVILKNDGFAGVKRADTILRRQGCLFGASLLDAGGRNMLLQLRSPTRLVRKEAVIATFLACQSWEWYPFFHLIIHALQPTALLVVDTSMKLPRDVYVKCLSAPSQYAYVEPIQKEDGKKEKGSNVQFSFQKPRTMQTSRLLSLRRSSSMGVKRRDTKKTEPAEATKPAEPAEPAEVTEVTKPAEPAEPTEPAEVKEPSEFDVINGCRVTLQQMHDLRIPDLPYQFVVDPLEAGQHGCVMGVMMVKKNAEHYTAYLDLKNDDGLPEQKCPQPFIYEIPPEPVVN